MVLHLDLLHAMLMATVDNDDGDDKPPRLSSGFGLSPRRPSSFLDRIVDSGEMADKEKDCQENHVDGNDWEVVSLSASMMASAADQMGFDPSNVSKDKEFKKSEPESSPLIMSSHFVFPPMEYETVKLKDSNCEFGNRVMNEDVIPGDEKGNTTNKTLEESFKTKLDGSLHGIQFSEKDKDPSFGGIDIGEGKATQEMSLVLEEEMLLNSHGINDDHAETGMSGSFPCNEQADDSKPINRSYQSPDSPLSYPNASSQIAENKNDRFSLPCGAWWKRHAITLYNHAKEANTMWSVIVVAALMGLAILGQRKQQEKPQLQQLQLRLSTNGQCINLMLGPMNKLESILATDHQHGSALGSAARNVDGNR